MNQQQLIKFNGSFVIPHTIAEIFMTLFSKNNPNTNVANKLVNVISVTIGQSILCISFKAKMIIIINKNRGITKLNVFGISTKHNLYKQNIITKSNLKLIKILLYN